MHQSPPSLQLFQKLFFNPPIPWKPRTPLLRHQYDHLVVHQTYVNNAAECNLMLVRLASGVAFDRRFGLNSSMSLILVAERPESKCVAYPLHV